MVYIAKENKLHKCLSHSRKIIVVMFRIMYVVVLERKYEFYASMNDSLCVSITIGQIVKVRSI